MKKSITVFVSMILLVAMVVTLVGCNQRQTFAPTATPISPQVQTEMPASTVTNPSIVTPECAEPTPPTETPTRTPGCVTSPPTATEGTCVVIIGTEPPTPTMKKAENKLEDAFVGSAADFSLKLFQKSYSGTKNSLISPVSVMTALAMTANGAGGKTLEQMETVLGGDLSIEELNGHLKTFLEGRENTEKVKINCANSVWFRDEENRLTVKQDFLKKSEDYYDAAVYKKPFDEQTVKDINQWVTENTDGMITEVLDQIPDDAVMYLINALMFDGEWARVYNENNIYEGSFTGIDGTAQPVKMMSSEENKYLDDGMAIGFVKNYAGGQYSFVALLPKEGISLDDYIAALSGEIWCNTLSQARDATVYATTPKFSYEADMLLNDTLAAMGMTDAFSAGAADFSKMAQSTRGNISIGRVIHKTFIAVDERGTRAGAVTAVEAIDESAPMEVYTVKLDRPFVYAIVDNATGLPIFMGAVVSLG